jgi:hypothetical protein
MLSSDGYAAVDTFDALGRQGNFDGLRKHFRFIGDARQ